MSDESLQAGDTPAPDANASPEVTPGSEAAPSPAAEDAGNNGKRDKFSERIDELTWYRREAERERDYLRSELDRLRTQPPKPEAPAVQGKKLADFNYDEDAYQTYLIQTTTQTATEAARQTLKEEQEREAANRRKATFSQREQAFAKDNPDYFERTRDPRVPFSKAMADVVAESEDGPALALYLANNLSQAAAIAQLPELAAARELGRIEAKLAVEREKAKAPPPVSQAPPPPAKLEGSGDSKVEKDPSEMSDAEFDMWRQKQISARRGWR